MNRPKDIKLLITIGNQNILPLLSRTTLQSMSQVNQPSQGAVGELQPSSSLGLYKVVYTATDASNNTSQAFKAIEFR